MLTETQFTDLITKVRSGDQDAALQLVRMYEPEIRRAARIRLTDPRLRRIVDSIDICQSVFGRFFKSATDGSFDLEKPEQLLALLTTMTRNRVIDEHRRQSTMKRDSGTHGKLDTELAEIADEVPGPRTAVAARELLSEIRSRLSPEELEIADHRHNGMSWDEIAAELKEPAEAIRKRLERALQRVRTELNIADSDGATQK